MRHLRQRSEKSNADPLYQPLPSSNGAVAEISHISGTLYFVSTDQLNKCACKQQCQTDRCSCRKVNLKCSDMCKCSDEEDAWDNVEKLAAGCDESDDDDDYSDDEESKDMLMFNSIALFQTQQYSMHTSST